jgi:DNA-binding NtrC family response regulator
MLLISRNHSLSEVVHGVVSHVQEMELSLVAGYDDACQRVAAKTAAIILVHLDPADNLAGLTRLLSTIKATSQNVPVLVLSEDHHAEQALMLLRLGVAEYLSRPLDLGRLGYLIDVLTVAGRRNARRQPAAAVRVPARVAIEIGESFLCPEEGQMGEMMEQIRRIAPQEATVLLGGETGTGKSRLAAVIHRLSSRSNEPFMTINCGALSSNLIESEMFGHVKGAFTGADANRSGKFADVGSGTLFLDEIDSLAPDLQAKLLRAVEERAFEPVGSNKTESLKARLIVAGNRPLDHEVACGRFRADLYYRLNVVSFQLLPLRERRDEIPILAQHFHGEFARRAGRRDFSIAPEALRALSAHAWPGNVRELRNVIERAVALSTSTIINIADLPRGFADPGPDSSRAPATVPMVSTLADSKDQAERRRISEAMLRNGNNRLRAANELGISRMTLYNKLHKLGLMASS